jgi:hypothetical protein
MANANPHVTAPHVTAFRICFRPVPSDCSDAFSAYSWQQEICVLESNQSDTPLRRVRARRNLPPSRSSTPWITAFVTVLFRALRNRTRITDDSDAGQA